MKSFRQFLEEGRASEIVHTNPNSATLKGIARASKHGSVRFVVFKDSTVLAGDAVNFTHHSLEPDASKLALRGYVDHDKENDRYFYTSMHPSKNMSTDDHPFLERLKKHGIQSGNNPEALSEAFDYTETRQNISHGQFELTHEAPVTQHHTLVIKHTITPSRNKKTYLSTDFGFKQPKSDKPHEIITQASHLDMPLPREHVAKVMTTVAKSTEEVMRTHKIYQGEFYANTGRKDRLYHKAVRRMAERLGGKHHEDEGMQYITIPSNKGA